MNKPFRLLAVAIYLFSSSALADKFQIYRTGDGHKIYMSYAKEMVISNLGNLVDTSRKLEQLCEAEAISEGYQVRKLNQPIINAWIDIVSYDQEKAVAICFTTKHDQKLSQ